MLAEAQVNQSSMSHSDISTFIANFHSFDYNHEHYKRHNRTIDFDSQFNKFVDLVEYNKTIDFGSQFNKFVDLN